MESLRQFDNWHLVHIQSIRLVVTQNCERAYTEKIKAKKKKEKIKEKKIARGKPNRETQQSDTQHNDFGIYFVQTGESQYFDQFQAYQNLSWQNNCLSCNSVKKILDLVFLFSYFSLSIKIPFAKNNNCHFENFKLIRTGNGIQFIRLQQLSGQLLIFLLFDGIIDRASNYVFSTAIDVLEKQRVYL